MKDLIYMIVIAVMIVVPSHVAYVLAGKRDDSTTLEVRNPFKVAIYIEVKCDNIKGTKEYVYYRKIKIPKKGGYRIIVPNKLRYCEIWALDYKIFE